MAIAISRQQSAKTDRQYKEASVNLPSIRTPPGLIPPAGLSDVAHQEWYVTRPVYAAGHSDASNRAAGELPPKGEVSPGYDPSRTFWSKGFPPVYDFLHDDFLSVADPKRRAERAATWNELFIRVRGPTGPFHKDPHYVWVRRSDWEIFKAHDKQHFQPPAILPGSTLPPSLGNPASPPPSLPFPSPSRDPPVRDQNPKIADGRPGGKSHVAGTPRPRKDRRPASTSAPVKAPQSQRSVPSGAPAPQTRWHTRQPTISRKGDKAIISHCEMLKPVRLPTSANPFVKNQVLPLNPGLPSSFPWLAREAQGWERFEFKKLVFHYMPKIGFTASGSVLIVPDFDPADPSPINEQVAFSYSHTSEGSPFEKFSASLPHARLHPDGPKLVRASGVPAKMSLNDFDAGVVTILMADMDAADVNKLWGRIWVEYTVELTVPQSNPNGLGTGQVQSVNAASVTTAAPLGVVSTDQGSSLVEFTSGTVITSQVESALACRFIYSAATSATFGSLTPSSDSSLGSNPTYGVGSSGSGTTSHTVSFLWNAKIGSTLTVAETLSGATTLNSNFVSCESI